MANYICVTCGVQHPESMEPPARCPVCEDERQYVGFNGQEWTTLDELRGKHKNVFRSEESRLTGIATEPKFAIGQRCFVVQSEHGNFLWECITYLDAATIEAVEALGGITGIAVSHPHYYSTIVEWSRAFGNVPVYLHSADREWVMRPDECIRFWDGETQPLNPDLTLIRCGGHFPGGTVMHWASGAGGRGALLTGDIIQVVPDRQHVSFMYSYPNMIPLNARAVRRVVDAVEPFLYERIYGIWPGFTISAKAKQAVRDSANRYIRAISD